VLLIGEIAERLKRRRGFHQSQQKKPVAAFVAA